MSTVLAAITVGSAIGAFVVLARQIRALGRERREEAERAELKRLDPSDLPDERMDLTDPNIPRVPVEEGLPRHYSKLLAPLNPDYEPRHAAKDITQLLPAIPAEDENRSDSEGGSTGSHAGRHRPPVHRWLAHRNGRVLRHDASYLRRVRKVRAKRAALTAD